MHKKGPRLGSLAFTVRDHLRDVLNSSSSKDSFQIRREAIAINSGKQPAKEREATCYMTPEKKYNYWLVCFVNPWLIRLHCQRQA